MKIENRKYNSFIEFLNDVLLPSGQLANKLDGFVYRGERTNKYKLLPGSLREENMERLFGENRPINGQEQFLMLQLHAEYSLLREFYKIANLNGLKIPKVDSISRNYMDMFPTELIIKTGKFKWLSEDIAELAALAQHYGVLTRLIDWSHELYVALYFASIGAIKAKKKEDFEKDDTLVIWALNAQYIQFLQPTVDRIPLKFVVPPYYDNPNLNAQKGILSYWEEEVCGFVDLARELLQSNNMKITDRTPLNVLLQRYCNTHPNKDDNSVILYKFEVPVHECISIYEFLRKIGYTAAKLFPGYDGVVKDMNELEMVRKLKGTI